MQQCLEVLERRDHLTNELNDSIAQSEPEIIKNVPHKQEQQVQKTNFYLAQPDVMCYNVHGSNAKLSVDNL